jgi:1-aminocyclopropane-1-carboxylate deaminase
MTAHPMITYHSTPIQELNAELLHEKGIELFIKCEVQNHPHVSGNKWWKLKYNLEEAKKLGYSKLLTFGGAFSNHIYATAAAANELEIESIGIIRGEETLPLNHTLSFAKAMGMVLNFVSRDTYRNKTEQKFIDDLHTRFGDFYLIPEGGSNQLAIKGCAEFGRQLKRELDFDYVCLPVGTGATMAGIIAGVGNSKKVIGFSALKGGDFLVADVKANLKEYADTDFSNWEIVTDFHFGGYAKTKAQLLDFKKSFETKYHIPLDHVYTAKMMAGIFDLVARGYFERGSTILVVHTGGLQGNTSVI